MAKVESEPQTPDCAQGSTRQQETLRQRTAAQDWRLGFMNGGNVNEMRIQWFKNGDHPQDYSRTHEGLDGGVWRIFPPEERKARGWEGDVVRYFRHPDVPGDTVCDACGSTMHEHGWLDSGDSGQIVCPGDWIVSIDGRHLVQRQEVT